MILFPGPVVLTGSVFSSTSCHRRILNTSCPSSGISYHTQSLVRRGGFYVLFSRGEKAGSGKGEMAKSQENVDGPTRLLVGEISILEAPADALFLGSVGILFLSHFLLYSSHVLHVLSSIPVEGLFLPLLSTSVFCLAPCYLKLATLCIPVASL